MKSIRLVSELEQISPRTLEWWWYEQKKQQEKAAEEAKKPTNVLVVNPGVNEPDRLHSQHKPPEPPRLLTDGGQLRCGRCGSNKHLEKREDDIWYCGVCEVVLAFDGFVDEGGTNPHYTELGKDAWMR